MGFYLETLYTSVGSCGTGVPPVGVIGKMPMPRSPGPRPQQHTSKHVIAGQIWGHHTYFLIWDEGCVKLESRRGFHGWWRLGLRITSCYTRCQGARRAKKPGPKRPEAEN